MRRIFPPHERRLLRPHRQTATSTDKGHGRIEKRKLTCTTELNRYLNWPGVAQVFRLERQRTIAGTTTTQIAYGITSLPRRRADARKLLTLAREHWGIENRLFHVRDVTFNEDRCRVRTGPAAQILAWLRNIVIAMLEAGEHHNKAAAMRRFNAQPEKALALIRGET